MFAIRITFATSLIFMAFVVHFVAINTFFCKTLIASFVFVTKWK